MSWNPFSKFFRKASDGVPDAHKSSEEPDAQKGSAQEKSLRSRITNAFHRWWHGEEEPFPFDQVREREEQEIVRAREQRIAEKAVAAAAVAHEAALTQTDVIAGESDQIGQKRGRTGSNDVVGLAFSGGGIRSATFNLGVIQGLARERFLTQIDYLSTVSGGGYIGGWLTAWIKRDGCANVQDSLERNAEQPPSGQGWRYLEPDPVRFLRNFSNYLAPRAGLVSTDTWALLSSYFRNVTLNLALLVASGAMLLLLPLLGIWLAARRAPGASLFGPALWIAVAFFFVALGVLAYSMASFAPDGESAADAGEQKPEPANQKPDTAGTVEVKWYVKLLALFKDTIQRNITGRPGWFVVLPLLIAAVCFTVLIKASVGGSKLRWVIGGAVLYGVLWTIANNLASVFYAIAQRKWRALFTVRGPKPVRRSPGWSLFAAFAAGGLGGFLVYGIKVLLAAIASVNWPPIDQLDPAPYYRLSAELVLGPPLILLAFTLISILHVGLLGTSFPDAKREWMARLCGMLALVATGYFLFTGIAVYGAIVFKFFFTSPWAHTVWGHALQVLLTGGWITTTALGVIGGNRSNSKPNGKGETGALLKLAPPVFVLGLALLLSAGLDAYLAHGFTRANAGAAPTVEELQQMVSETASAGGAGAFVQHFSQLMAGAASPSWRASLHQASVQHWLLAAQYLSPKHWGLLYLLIALFVVARILSWRLDVNEFSIHLLYRNRLTRCYLGASHHDRDPQAFTGFDMNDDIPLAELAVQPREAEPRPMSRWAKLTQSLSFDDSTPSQRCYDGPYPLVCTALNLVSGKDLAWQKRKARSFIYSPLFCGYDYFSTGKRDGRLGVNAYRPTPSFSGEKGPYLGTAMAISGAAASPNMGYHSSPALTFLMGVFNVRLGWWAGNTRHASSWKLPGPRSATYLALELFGRTDDEKRFVYLSDGGHFENLGLYELVRRRCRYIIVCDASCDPAMSFSNLGNAIEKCRRDLGAEIDIDISRLRLRHGERLSKDHYAVGTIRYKDSGSAAGNEPGLTSCLLYIKSSLTGKEPEDVQAYAAEHPAFPHDSTAEQFFDETRFESYRALGQNVFRCIAEDVAGAISGSAVDKQAAKVGPSRITDFFDVLENKNNLQKAPVRTGSIDMEEVPFGKMKLTFEAL